MIGVLGKLSFEVVADILGIHIELLSNAAGNRPESLIPRDMPGQTPSLMRGQQRALVNMEVHRTLCLYQNIEGNDCHAGCSGVWGSGSE